MDDTKDFIRRAEYALHDMQGRVDAGKLEMFSQAIDRLEAQAEHLKAADELVNACADLGGISSARIMYAREQYRKARKAANMLEQLSAERNPDARHEGWNDAIEAAARMVEPADSADRDVARILQMAAAGIRSLLRDEGKSHD